jgi:hypothetical protein
MNITTASARGRVRPGAWTGGLFEGINERGT